VQVRADALLRAATGSRFTAAVLRVERHGRAVFERAYGALDGDPGARPAEVTTRFDLASLTKLFVATAALRAAARRGFSLEAPLLAEFPDWRGTAHAAVSLRMLLAHTGGFASGADYRTLFSTNVERFARTRDLVATPGERVLYSDLGFITLGAWLERFAGSSLVTAMSDVNAALGCEATAYRPRNDEPQAIPATELDAWRGRVRGAVHDEKAYLMNGIAGHAGLFGTAHDVAALADLYLAAACGRAGASAALPAALAREAIVEHGDDLVLRRGLGWALKTTQENSCGTLMDRTSFGHTGFTGTVVWADPTRDLSVVLLTNAVYYGRSDLRDLRAAVCDACVREFA
jgi:CubicO group peptidase (beta-lactamase class C family)